MPAPRKPPPRPRPVEISVEGTVDGKKARLTVRGAVEHAELLTDSAIRLSRLFDRPPVEPPDESEAAGTESG